MNRMTKGAFVNLVKEIKEKGYDANVVVRYNTVLLIGGGKAYELAVVDQKDVNRIAAMFTGWIKEIK